MDINGFVGKLNPDIQIINYMLGKDTLYTFLINKSGISVRSKSISYDSLKSLVMNYVYTINNTIKIFKKYDQNKVDRHYQLTTSLANQLSNILINDEILNKLNSNSTMYIIPDDFLHFIPFATLVIEKESEIKFLIEKTNIAYLPGIFSSFGKSKRNDKSSKNKVLLATDPAMPNMGKLTGFVNRQYPETHILKTDGEVMYKQEILAGIENKYDIYIFAGHSYSSSWNIADSYIEVTVRSSGDIKNQIFQLTMPDINGMNWNSSDLIFLLGCETAGGNLYRGMGISGLQSSFLLSGADNILASLWRIDAVQSIKQATDFLSEYKKTNDIAGSIRHSQLTAINRLKLNNYFKNPHPYFWGSYLLAQNKISFINRR